MKRRRVKITGIGPVTPAGVGREPFWRGILEPVSRVRPFGKLGQQYGPLVAAHLDPFDAAAYVDQTRVPNGSARHTLFAITGAVLALQDAGIAHKDLQGLSCAIVTGTTVMDFGGIVSSMDAVQKHGSRGAKPRTMYTINTATISGAINEVLEISARTMAVQSSCCSGLDAVGFAAELVAEGEVDLAICGGTEAPLHRFPLLELRAAGLTPPTTDMPDRLDRPFDLWRTTGVVSEGAAMFVIEAESSRRVGYSYISGYAFANDDQGDLCSGIAIASRLALADAQMRPAQIEAINAWGPGHKLIDAGEARAMARIFAAGLAEIPVVSIKGSIGNPLGAAGAIQIAATALAQRESLIPPTVNWDYPDPACPLNLSKHPRAVAHGVTMINGHGLAGVNSSMILERC
jgi:3-oxoacyl-(acyl-carrier-protein) synthase